MILNNRIKDTFNNIHAESELKEETKNFILNKTKNNKLYNISTYKKVIPVIICFIFVVIGFSGYKIYFTEASIISIDINPSLELNLNRFGKVISVKSYNDDGYNILKDIDIKYMDYRSAIEKILKTQSMSDYLSENEMLSIAVVGKNEQESRKILDNIQNCVPKQKNICCYAGNSDDVKEAHSAGISVGKYRAFLELQEVNPDVTLDDIKELTMRQIRDMINKSSDNKEHHNNNENNGNKHGNKH